MASLRVGGQLAETGRLLGRSSARLASGLRIATAADDPSGLGVAERMRAQLRSFHVARRNAADGISLLQVAEGALGELADIVLRTRELGLQAANGTLTRADRDVIEGERRELAEEVSRIIDTTEFNGQKVFLPGDTLVGRGVEIQVGPDAGDVIELEAPGVRRVALLLGVLRFDDPDFARLSLRFMDFAERAVSRARGSVGALANRLESAMRSIDTSSVSHSAALSRIQDVDVATETAEQVRLRILQESAAAVLAQANASPALALQLLWPATELGSGPIAGPAGGPGSAPTAASPFGLGQASTPLG